MNNSKIIIYGSYGYTGSLIAKECNSRNLDVILAGRNEASLKSQSDATHYPYEVVDFQDETRVRNVLSKGKVVIHCGGPFQYTANEMARACLDTKTHYTDITGEYAVFELLSGFDDQALHAGITLIPGTGFDVVPSDCLALHLKNKLPSASHLQLAFASSGGGFSRGTYKTMIEGLGYGSMIRKDKKLTAIPTGSLTQEIDYGPFKLMSLNIPWGDISTAWRSTGIPNIEVYIGSNAKQIAYARRSNYINWLLRMRWVKDYLAKRIDRKPAGPGDEKRIKGRMYLWGKVWDKTGKEFSARLKTPDGYTLTAKSSVLIAEKILNGDFKPGYQTPAMAYGENLVLEIKGSTLTDLPFAGI